MNIASLIEMLIFTEWRGGFFSMKIFYVDIENLGLRVLPYILNCGIKKGDLLKIIYSKNCTVDDFAIETEINKSIGKYDNRFLDIEIIESGMSCKEVADRVICMQMVYDLCLYKDISEVIICTNDRSILYSAKDFCQFINRNVKFKQIYGFKQKFFQKSYGESLQIIAG